MVSEIVSNTTNIDQNDTLSTEPTSAVQVQDTSSHDFDAPEAQEAADINSAIAEVQQLEDDFGDMGLMRKLQAPAETAMLDEVVKGTPFEIQEAETGGVLTMLDIADGHLEESDEEFGRWIRGAARKVSQGITSAARALRRAIANRARRLISKLHRFIRKYSKYASCIPKIVKAIALFKAQKFGQCIKWAVSALSCINSKRAAA